MTVSSDSLSLGPGPQSTWRALTASMHWPNVSPRTAMPLAMGTTSVMPGIALTASRLLTLPTLPLIVGGRQTMQGLASGTWRSWVNCLRPVTMSRASTRLVGFPTRVKADSALSSTSTGLVCETAALVASSP